MSLGQDAVVSILADVIPEPVGAAVAILFASQTYNSVQFCGQGDVGDPGMSAQDWSDAVDFTNPVVNLPARTKAQQWFQHIIFPVLCNCSDGSTPPTPVVTGPPSTGGPAGVPNSQVGSNCWDNKNTKSSSAPNTPIVWSDILPPIAATYSSPPAGVVGIPSPIPSSISTIMTVGTEGSNALAMQYQMTFYNATGQVITGGGQISNITPGSGPQTHNWPIPATAANWALGSENNVGSSTVATNNVTFEAVIYCQGQTPTNIVSPCCPPDPVVQGQLGAIFQMLTELLSLQGLQGPYQDTTRHAGLSGNGTIAINPASSAIRVEVRSDLSNWPQNVQTPPYFYSLGFVTPFAVGTPLKGQRLVYDKQTFTWPSYTDTIGYSLAAGITVDLVELTRGA